MSENERVSKATKTRILSELLEFNSDEVMRETDVTVDEYIEAFEESISRKVACRHLRDFADANEGYTTVQVYDPDRGRHVMALRVEENQ